MDHLVDILARAVIYSGVSHILRDHPDAYLVVVPLALVALWWVGRRRRR